jgi:hypothetical protein
MGVGWLSVGSARLWLLAMPFLHDKSLKFLFSGVMAIDVH